MLAIALLNGCGGGSGGDNAGAAGNGGAAGGTLPVEGEAKTEDEFISIGVVGQEDRGPYRPNLPFIPTHTIYAAIDLKDPALPREVMAWSAGEERVKIVPALRFDPARGSVTVLGPSKAFYLQTGRLFQVDLRRSESRVARRLTSHANICRIAFVFPSNWSAKDGWVAVDIPSAAGGQCYSLDAQPVAWVTRYIRFNAAASDVAVQLPGDKRLLGPLPTVNEDGPWFFFTGTWDPHSIDPAPVDAALASTAGRSQALPAYFDYSRESGLQVPAPLAELIDRWVWEWVSDWQMSEGDDRYQIGSGLTVDKLVTGVARPLVTLDPSHGATAVIKAVTATHVLVQQNRFVDGYREFSTLWSVPRSGGAPVQLSEDADESLTYPMLTFLGHDHSHAYYAVRQKSLQGRFGGTNIATHRARLNDGARTPLSVNASTMPLPLMDRQSRLAVPPIRGLAWVDYDNPYDAVGTLKVFDTEAAQTRHMGQFPDALIYGWNWNVLGSPNGKSIFWDSTLAVASSKWTEPASASPSQRQTRFYTARPDVADSLRPVAQLP